MLTGEDAGRLRAKRVESDAVSLCFETRNYRRVLSLLVPSPPSGTVTFLFTDIEGSTRLWEERPDEMPAALADHDQILRSTIEAHGGYIFSTGGDGFAAAFSRAADAVDAAAKVQASLSEHEFIRTRMGIHTGEVQERGGDYFGPAVNRAARIMGVAHGGQVVCSAATEALLSSSVHRVDLGEHRLRDLLGPQRVYQVGEGEFPRLRSVEAYSTNLPAQVTTFVGRERDMEHVAAALAVARLFTVIGVGGVGKTRLAIQVAADVLPRFADGAWVCELATVGDAEALEDVVAAALGANQRQGMTLRASIVEYLQPKHLLLVLDNCEHLLDRVARLVDAVLRGCPHVTVLCTSREALALEGEHVWPLRSLALPDPEETDADPRSFAAVRLFQDRAAAVKPGFVVENTTRRLLPNCVPDSTAFHWQSNSLRRVSRA